MKSDKSAKTGLNDGQKRAVEIQDGPALVVAGAGTGKTKVIVERVVRLIKSGVKPDSIAALTFTEKAAQEMQDRINELRGGYTFDVTVMTYNAFGEQLLRQYATDIGMNRNLVLLGEVAKLVFLRDNLEALKLDYYAPLTRPDGLLDEIATYISSLKQHLVTVEKYQHFIANLPAGSEDEKLEKARHQELARCFQTYQELTKQHNVIDYDDQIYLLVQLLDQRPNVLKKLQAQYRYLLVDEFQDTNPMQAGLLDRLSQTQSRNIMVVGDDDQSIYAWRGATVENILTFKDRYPGASEEVLTINYRSSQAILDAAYRLIQFNNPHRLESGHGINKQLTADKPAGPAPTIRRFLDRPQEFQWIASNIKRRIDDGQPAGSIAVLARRNSTVMHIHTALDQADIEHQVAGQTYDLYRQPIIKALLEILKAIADPYDNKALFHGLSGAVFTTIDTALLSDCSARANRSHERLHEVLRAEPDQALQAALAQIEQWRQLSANLSVGRLLYQIIDTSGLKTRLIDAAETEAVAHQAFLDVAKLFDVIKEFERIAERSSVQAFVDSLPMLMASGEQTVDDTSLMLSNEAVAVTTIHKAKGLEWQTVYIADLVEKSFPMQNFGSSMEIPDGLAAFPGDKDERMREERRLMYVAVTRARQDLILTLSSGNGQRPRQPSRFLAELCPPDEELPISDNLDELGLDMHQPTELAIRKLPANMRDQNGYLSLSVSQLTDWLRCPYDFYWRHVLRVPSDLSPTLLYGSVIHGVIENYHKSRLDGQALTAKQIKDQLHANWPAAGFDSKAHSDRALKAAKQTLADFIKREATNQPPASVEQPFTIKLEPERLIIRGRYDTVYELAGGNGTEIRDYKTGESVTSADKAKRRATGSDQLTLYALAWQQLSGELPAKLTLDFVETGQVGSVTKTQRGIDSMLGKLAQAAKSINQLDFKRGRDHSYCQHD